MRVGVIRVVLDRLEDFALGCFLPAFLAGGDAEIIMCRGALGVNGQRLGQRGQRFIEFLLQILNDAERSMRKLVARRQRDRFLQRQLSGFESAGAKIDDAEI